MLENSLDMTLVLRGGFWTRAGLQNQDGHLVRTGYSDDEYHLRDNPPAREAEVFVDVGAAIGSVSKLFHDRNPRSRIFSIEANARNIPCLERNVSEFATVIHAACTYEPGELGLYDSLFDGTDATGGSIVGPAAEVAAYRGAQYLPRPEPIPKITLDELIERYAIDSIDVLKLDCEGSEYSILGHCGCLDRVRTIVGEYHGGRAKFEAAMRPRFPPAAWSWAYWDLGSIEQGIFRLTRIA